MKRRLVLAVICLMFIIGPSCVMGQAPVGELAVTGQVKGASGDTKSFVRVQLEGPGSYVALTNSKGQFSLKGVGPGSIGSRSPRAARCRPLPCRLNGARWTWS